MLLQAVVQRQGAVEGASCWASLLAHLASYSAVAYHPASYSAVAFLLASCHLASYSAVAYHPASYSAVACHPASSHPASLASGASFQLVASSHPAFVAWRLASCWAAVEELQVQVQEQGLGASPCVVSQ